MVNARTLPAAPGYEAAACPRVASFAAQLDDQLARLRQSVAGLEVAHLQWQPRPGVNTIGMLLAHLAVVDVWWITIAPAGDAPPARADAIFRRIIGIGMDDDGLPCPADGTHPSTLAGHDLSQYLQRLDAARASSHAVLRTWRDADLGSTYVRGDRAISREWTLYHVLEHFASHYGQILLLMHLMRDAGVLAAPAPD